MIISKKMKNKMLIKEKKYMSNKNIEEETDDDKREGETR
jgi:hypothetical protein